MSQFNYADYQKAVAKAQQGQGASTARKVGFFKLKDDGDRALVRINCHSVDDLEFASVHTVSTGGRWLRVSCLNPLNSYSGHCPLCDAVKEGKASISKASKKVYLQMLVSYKDKATGKFLPAEPVVWERPAMFSQEIANMLNTYQDLTKVLMIITRNGKAGDMKTTYSLMLAPAEVFDPSLVPADFSAFDNFDISKHSYWEKTPEEINTFLTTGAFPEVARNAAPKTSTQYEAAPGYNQAPTYTQPAIGVATQAVVNPANNPQGVPQAAIINPQAAPVADTPVQTAQPAAPQERRNVRPFSEFSF